MKNQRHSLTIASVFSAAVTVFAAPGTGFAKPKAPSPKTAAEVALESVDHRGNCRGGTPSVDGETKVTAAPGKGADKGKGAALAIDLTAYGSEYGHHCGEDQGRFAHVSHTGDFDVSAQVMAITNNGAQHFKKHATPAKAGIMARESNEPDARYVAIWAVSNDAGDLYPDSFHFDLRKSKKAWLGSKPKGDFVYGYANKRDLPKPGMFVREYPNVWVRLVRKDNRFSAFVSKDGKTWEPTSTPTHELDLAPTLVVGVGLSSAPEGKFDAKSTARFENVRGLASTAAKK